MWIREVLDRSNATLSVDHCVYVMGKGAQRVGMDQGNPAAIPFHAGEGHHVRRDATRLSPRQPYYSQVVLYVEDGGTDVMTARCLK